MADALQDWRLNWKPEDIAWRSGWQATADDARLERERLIAERRARDRQHFGMLLPGATKERRSRDPDTVRLQALNLPSFASEQELADWLNISQGRLRWFTQDRLVDAAWHYVRYTIPKRRGGQRTILAPKTELKAIQRLLLTEILEKIPVHEAAHGFVMGRSVVSNAALHQGKQFVLNMDLQDFFPSIDYGQVRGLFYRLGYRFTVASVLALLCTERERFAVTRNGKPVYASIGERTLVQGAPTSPAISNLLARRLDARLSGLARKLGLTYTRYADDLTFSGDDLGAILGARYIAPRIIAAEKFTLHPEKTRLYRQSNRQIVTGLVVNEKVNTPRELRRMVRAILHNAANTGLTAQNRHQLPDFRAYLHGLIGYIAETDAALAQRLLEQLKTLRD
jgi:retron-type reverse transcriptase